MQNFRNQLTKIDTEIIKLLDARFTIVDAIKTYKHKHNIAIHQPKREQEIYALIENMAKFHPQIKAIYAAILTASKEYQT